MNDMIGPLTPAAWAMFRLRHDDRGALPACCGTVSDFRDAVFDLLRNHDDLLDIDGNVMPSMVSGFRAAYWDMVAHGLPETGEDLIDRIAHYYLGDPPAPATDLDRMHGDQVYVELCNYSGQPTPRARPSRFAVCALPETHPDYRYLVLHVDLRRVDPVGGDRWTVRWGAYLYNADTRDWDFDSIPEGMDVTYWRERHEFRLSYAMQLAQSLANTVDVNGKTAADVAAADLARAGEGR